MRALIVELHCQACHAKTNGRVALIKGVPSLLDASGWFMSRATAHALLYPDVTCPKHSPTPPPKRELGQ